MTALRRPRLGALRDIGTGIAAVGVKELRGRMRGKRAFVMLTIYLLIVAGFAWMVESFAEMTFASGMVSGASAAAEIGRQMFTGLLMLLTLVVLVLAPASTAGAISLEREKQTLDLLTTTPISSLAIVLGKLLSALSWVFLLLLASIPVSALVFAFGGVGPDDMVKGYVVLFGTAIGYGALGLFVSALLKRTQAATVINLVLVIVLTVGTTFIFIFWTVFSGSSGFMPDGGVANRPPEALLWLNPFVAEVDVVCGTDTGFGASCQIVAAVTGNQQAINQGGQAFGVGRDTYWPRALAATAALAVLLIILSVQLVSPTRRWHIRRPRRRTAGSTP